MRYLQVHFSPTTTRLSNQPVCLFKAFCFSVFFFFFVFFITSISTDRFPSLLKFPSAYACCMFSSRGCHLSITLVSNCLSDSSSVGHRVSGVLSDLLDGAFSFCVAPYGLKAAHPSKHSGSSEGRVCLGLLAEGTGSIQVLRRVSLRARLASICTSTTCVTRGCCSVSAPTSA